jgi:hypothetical protein
MKESAKDQTGSPDRNDTPPEAQSAINTWEFFVQQCVHGFRFEISEYDNEIRSRDRIEVFLRSAEFRALAIFDVFATHVQHLDDEFRKVLFPDIVLEPSQPWWHGRVLRYAGRDYAEYMLERYGITVEVVE